MENQDQNTPEQVSSSISLELKAESLRHLREASKWARFIAIVGFVMVGLMVLGALVVAFTFSNFENEFFPAALGGVGIALLYLVIAAIYFFPILYLFRFAQASTRSVKNSNSSDLVEAMRNLKSHYLYIGVLLIVFIGIYALFFLAMIIGGVFSGMM